MIDSCVLADGVLTVVAAFAIRGYALVIKHAGGEAIGVMTRSAILCGGYMVS